jgi:hypothetical protein
MCTYVKLGKLYLVGSTPGAYPTKSYKYCPTDICYDKYLQLILVFGRIGTSVSILPNTIFPILRKFARYSKEYK